MTGYDRLVCEHTDQFIDKLKDVAKPGPLTSTCGSSKYPSLSGAHCIA